MICGSGNDTDFAACGRVWDVGMELQILHMIQGWHQDWLDAVMIFFSTLGNGGFIWIVAGIVMLAIPRTRKCGVHVLLAMAVTYLLGNLFLKNLIARPRPCAVDTSVKLLIPYPSEYSFPSGHTSNGFAAAVSIYMCYRKPGTVALLVAGIIAFSRMYLFVHYPTDILGGILLGIFDAWLVSFLVKKYWSRQKA